METETSPAVEPVAAASAPAVEPVAAVEAKVEKVLTKAEQYAKTVESYFAAIKAGNKKLAAQIHAENNLPYSVGTHS